MVGSASPRSISLVADGRNPSMDLRARHDAPQGPQHSRTIRGVYPRADLMTSPAPHMPLAAVNSTTGNRLSSGTAATPTPSAGFAARPSSVPVATIVFGAVGGVIVLAVILALIYVIRVRRRVKCLKRSTNVLGPELTPMSRPPDRANVGVTITLDSHVKVDDVSPLSPAFHGRLRSSSTPSVTSVTEQAFRPLSTTRRSTIAVGTSPAVSPLSPHWHQSRRSLSSNPPSITSPTKENFSSLSPTRRHTSTVVIGSPPAVSLQTPEQHGRRSLSLSTPLVTPSTKQASSPSSPTRRRRPAISVDIPSSTPPLTLHQYGRRSSPMGTSPTEHASSPQSPTRRRRRRRTISVDTPPAVPPLTPDLYGRFPGSPLAGDVTTSPTPGSTTIIDPPPPAARRASIRHSNSRALIRSSNTTRPWHFPSSHPRHQPQYDGERSARSDSYPEA
ncbi:hypothetical protein BJV78DRAFT_1217468 [Lactifluus subvellereus]|nr:hypothetical protein BJV78DRAFT_1217468 [Lactifluus subvellereus]